MKYIVMETHPAYAVVLDEKGSFVKVANFGYKVGDTVTDVVIMAIPEAKAPQKRNITRICSAIAVACLCLVLIPAFLIMRKPAASVYMKINPQVRIDLNRKDEVVDIIPINDDGVTLLENYQYKGKDFDTVLDELVDLAIEKNFLKDGGDVTLTMEGDDEWVYSRAEPMGERVNKRVPEEMKVKVHVKHKPHGRHDDDDDDDDDDEDLYEDL